MRAEVGRVYVLGHVGLTLLANAVVPRRWRLPFVWLAVGALLPDLIDKPLGHLVLQWDSGRLFAHTLLFHALLAGLVAIAWTAWPAATRPLLALTLGSLGHLALDQMWTAPEVLWWPLLGDMPHGHWTPGRYVSNLFASRYVWVTEAAGAVALLAAGLGVAAWRRRARPAP